MRVKDINALEPILEDLLQRNLMTTTAYDILTGTMLNMCRADTERELERQRKKRQSGWEDWVETKSGTELLNLEVGDSVIIASEDYPEYKRASCAVRNLIGARFKTRRLDKATVMIRRTA